MRRIFAALLVMLVPQTAQAAWLEASSPHFVVYANDSEKDLRTFSQQLERYHAALEVLTGTKPPVPSPSNRVTVYVVSEREVGRLYGKNSENIGAFYVPRAGGSIAIVPQVSTAGASTGNLAFSMVALLHEYAHHFMISSSAYAMPKWLSEGGAEFFASAAFQEDGDVQIGRPAHHRAGELFFARDVTATELLDPEAYEKRNRGKSFDAFYGKSWLLYHYLTLGGDRKGEIEEYVRLLLSGKSSRDAGFEVFGPFDKLERDLDGYLKKPRMSVITLRAAMLETGKVNIRPLSEGEAAMVPFRVRSKVGVTEEQAKALLKDIRPLGQRFPADAAVQSALAEAEFDAGNDAEAIAAADRALALDRNQVNAYVQKGFALFHQAENGSDPAAFVEARVPFVALNRIENDHPLALSYYYRSYAETGQKLPKLAVDALERAVQLAPFDLGLRINLAMQQLRDGHPDQAKLNLAPVAYNPHASKLTESAKAILARLEKEPTWDGRGIEIPDEDAAPDDKS